SIETVARLALRAQQTSQAKQGLTKTFTIGGRTDVGYAFLFGQTDNAIGSSDAQALTSLLNSDPSRTVTQVIVNPATRKGGPLQLGAATKATGRSLERPQQFSIGWTTLPNVDQSGRPSLRLWGETLSDADTATEQFWPTIAQHGFGYNLIVPERVTRHKAAT